MKNLRIKVCQIDSPAPVSFSGPVFCQVGFDDSTVQRTPNAHNAKKLCWNSTLNCKHSNINKSSELKVKLCYSKNKKTCELNAATVPLSNLQNMTFQTRYETLNIKGQVGSLSVFVFVIVFFLFGPQFFVFERNFKCQRSSWLLCIFSSLHV